MCDCNKANFNPEVFAFETITVSTAVKLLTVATYQPQAQGEASAIAAFMTNAVSAIRWRADGVVPTSSVGHVLAAGDALTLCAHDLRKFRCIRDTAESVDAILSVSYSHEPSGPA